MKKKKIKKIRIPKPPNPNHSKAVSFRLDKEAEKQVEDLLRVWEVDSRSVVIRRCIERAYMFEVLMAERAEKKKAVTPHS